MRKKSLLISFLFGIISLIIFTGTAFSVTSNHAVTVRPWSNALNLIGSFGTGMNFTGITAYTQSSNKTLNLNEVLDFISVDDYSGTTAGTEGHRVYVKLSTSLWTYAGSDINYSNPSVATTTLSPDAIQFKITKTSSVSLVFSELNPACTTNTLTTNTIFITSTSRKIAQNTSTCPGISTYPFRSATITSGLRGLGKGTYSAKMIITLIDGQN